MNNQPEEEKNSEIEYRKRQDNASSRGNNQEFEINIRVQWILVPVSIFISFVISYYNDVSIYEILKRCFYTGVVFWLLAEIIEYIVRKKD